MYILAGCFLLSAILGQAQTSSDSEFRVKFLRETRSDLGLSYNFFAGPDNDDFRTTINGFGSGFLLDFSGRMSKDIVDIGTDKVSLSLGVGLALMKYRFSENIVFATENGQFSYFIDDDPSRDYGEGFFSYGKSKLVMGNIDVPLHLNFHTKDVMISATGMVEFYLTGKHKRKFKEDGDDKEKVVIRNDAFNDFPVNKVKFGVGGMFLHKPTGMSAGIMYMLTPFFEDNLGPEINEVRISFGYSISYE